MAVATTPSDIDLLHHARTGDQSAFTELYVRHRTAALRVAQCYGANGDAEDMVNAAFERVMAAVRRGAGPVEAFRPYLYVTIRHLAMERSGRTDHQSLDDVPEAVVAVSDLPAVDASERALILEAFAALPDRWQAVLWQVAVDGRPPREVARTTGLPPNTVAVLAHRARERLRQTYLQAHVQASDEDRCAPHRARLGAYVRGGLSARQQAAAEEHLATCESCARLVGELDDVNRLLGRAVLPAFALAGDGGLALGAGAGATGTAGLSVGAGGTVTGAAVASGTAAAGIGTGVSAAVVAKLATVAAAVIGAVTLAPHDGTASRNAAPTAEIELVVAGHPRDAVDPSPDALELSVALVTPVPSPGATPHAQRAPAPLPAAPSRPDTADSPEPAYEPDGELAAATLDDHESEHAGEFQVETPAPAHGRPTGEADFSSGERTGPAPVALSRRATTGVPPGERTGPAAQAADRGAAPSPTAAIPADHASGSSAATAVAAPPEPPAPPVAGGSPTRAAPPAASASHPQPASPAATAVTTTEATTPTATEPPARSMPRAASDAAAQPMPSTATAAAPLTPGPPSAAPVPETPPT